MKKCPRCMQNNTTIVSNTHYVCNNPNCINDYGKRTQFKILKDNKIRFPYNQIFVDRIVDEFYRKPYLEINNSINALNV